MALGAVSDYSALIQSAASRYALSPALLAAVIQTESSGNPNAVGSSGEQGLMQLMPATAAQLGVTNPFDPAQNIDGGARYLAQLISRYGDVGTALAAYNWGPGNVDRGGTWPTSTQRYVSTILAQAGMSSSTGGTDGTQPIVDVSGDAATTPTASLMDQISAWIQTADTTAGLPVGEIAIATAAAVALYLVAS